MGLRMGRWRRGYATAIFFDFGQKIVTSKDGQFLRGSYSLCLDMCPWKILEQNKKVGNHDQDYKDTDLLLSKFENQTIKEIKISHDLAKTEIIFSNDLVIQTQHSNKDDQWYLLAPKLELVVGYNCKISIRNLTKNKD
ncbi:hypothetical protein KKD03_02815 [Patescibacteria group bacterium]|nr:hypothetical protein [Patescibacteria group bacterium]